MRYCRNCEAKKAYARGRCEACYRYWIRNKQERPPHLAERQPELNYRNFNRRREREILARLLNSI